MGHSDDARGWPSVKDLCRISAAALAGGCAIGLVGGLFRWLLAAADDHRDRLLAWVRLDPSWRWAVAVLGAAAAVALARHIVRWVPQAAGSGVQRVEAELREEIAPVGIRLVAAKFVGGLLSLGAGMALGREGPTVQMGASFGADAGHRFGASAHDVRTISAGAAGAGLAVAFGAPMGGAMFVFEEVARAFRLRLALATFVAVSSAVAVSWLLLGTEPIFSLPAPVSAPSMASLPVYAVLGLLLGAAGVAYNKLVIFLLNVADAAPRLVPEAKAAIVGGMVGLLGLAAPELIGGGDVLNQEILNEQVTLGYLALILLVRWLLGPLCYSVSTPGGLFAPLLAVGAAAGALFAWPLQEFFPALGISLTAAAIVGMSTFFAAVVRAPFTGVILIVEMTATTALVVPMIIAAAGALLSATVLHGPPVYDTLRHRMEAAQHPGSRTPEP
ncbi:chloride channel protein [Nonomuraea sp. CA-218870]|uniref:chloride channel protein n=1 Tax=Nonomuraea sp. CA-218870 TaxID=3239998 RepID=UPI003D943DD2